MTKKDYILLARVIEDLPLKPIERTSVAMRIASALAIDNPARFDREKFLKACGV